MAYDDCGESDKQQLCVEKREMTTKGLQFPKGSRFITVT